MPRLVVDVEWVPPEVPGGAAEPQDQHGVDHQVPGSGLRLEDLPEPGGEASLHPAHDAALG
eukprot:369360-Lingulodinium_polyedra.AAC.1